MVLLINILIAVILVCSATAFGALAAKAENRTKLTPEEDKWAGRFGLFTVASIINLFVWNSGLAATTSFIIMGVAYGLVPLMVFIWNHINAT